MKRLRLLFIASFMMPLISFAQKDTLVKKLDSLRNLKDSAGQVNIIDPTAYNENTKITFKNYFILLASDLKQEFTKPFHMRSKDWWNFAKFSGVLVAASFADRPVQKFAARITKNNTGLKNISGHITDFGGNYETYTLATIAAYGIVFKKPKMVTTTLLATQAYFTGAALENITKFLTGRTRPSYYGPNEEPRPRFLGPAFYKNAKDSNGIKRFASFPSGHTTVAFAAATVFASEYKDKPYVPVIAYSAATLIGLSRLTENAHWLTDVMAGAAVGFLAGKNVVNNYHRYARLKSAEQKKNSVSLNLQYFNHQLVPGVVYHMK